MPRIPSMNSQMKLIASGWARLRPVAAPLLVLVLGLMAIGARL